MIEYLFSFPGIFFLALIVLIFLCLAVQRILQEEPTTTFSYENSIAFFENNSDLIAIIGVIAAIISLAPLFLTFFLGEDWFHLLLTTQIGILTLWSLQIATFSASLFMICLIILIFSRWVGQIFLNLNVRLTDKIISFMILLIGIIAIFCLAWVLSIAWFSRINIPVDLTGLTIFTFFMSFCFIMVIAFLIDITSLYPYFGRIISAIGLVVFFFCIVGITIFPTINNGITVYKIMSNYSIYEPHNLSFQNISPIKINGSPMIVEIQPDFSDFKGDDINIDYYDCHWSTNYGYFFTIESDSMLTQKRNTEFIIPKCLQPPKYSVFWTSEISDISKNKPPVIISLQIENSNRRSVKEKLGESMEYIIGKTHSNLTWIEQDNISIERDAVF